MTCELPLTSQPNMCARGSSLSFIPSSLVCNVNIDGGRAVLLLLISPKSASARDVAHVGQSAHVEPTPSPPPPPPPLRGSLLSVTDDSNNVGEICEIQTLLAHCNAQPFENILY